MPSTVGGPSSSESTESAQVVARGKKLRNVAVITVAMLAAPARVTIAAVITSAFISLALVAPVAADRPEAPTLSEQAQADAAPACTYADVAASNTDYADWAVISLDTTYRVSISYVPPDLSGTGISGGGSVRGFVVPDLQAMAAAAASAGGPLQVVSSYRSYATQVSTFNYWVNVSSYQAALLASARPGHSEHQLGTALDFTSRGGSAPWNYSDWATTTAGAWMRDHAWEYGFINSYPRGKSPSITCYQYEPWHYRYFGRAAAAAIHASGLTSREWLWANGGVLSCLGATYHPITPARVLDSRLGLGATTFYAKTKQTVTIANGSSGVPTSAVAVTGNVTITGQGALGYVAVAPSLTTGVEPGTSTINFPLRDDRANGLTVPLASGGKLDFMYWAGAGAGAGSTIGVIFDVTGYFSADSTGATYHPITPARVLDSRFSLGATTFYAKTKQTVLIANGTSGIPTTAVAVTGNVTITGQGALGYVAVAPSLTTGVEPGTSTINFPLGDDRANGLTVPLASGGKLDFMYWAGAGAGAGAGSTIGVIFDVTGYFSADSTGATYHPITPARVLDSRFSLGATTFYAKTKQTVLIANGTSGIPTTAVAVTGNVTITGQGALGYVAVAPSLTTGVEPGTSTINFPLGDDRANGLTVPLASGGKL